MAKPERIEVTETLDKYLDLEDPVLDVIARLRGYIKDYPNHTLFIEMDYDYGSEGSHLELLGTRLENDKEYAARKKRRAKEREKKAQAKLLAVGKERELYSKLHKKYGSL